jgi:hypothetical protein
MSKTCWQKKSLCRKSKTCSQTYAVQNQTEAFCTRQEQRKALIETEPQAARPRSQNPRTSGRNKCSRRRRGTLRETGRAYQTTRADSARLARSTRLRRKIESARFARSTGRKTRGGAVSRRRHGLMEIKAANGGAETCGRNRLEEGKRQRVFGRNETQQRRRRRNQRE